MLFYTSLHSPLPNPYNIVTLYYKDCIPFVIHFISVFLIHVCATYIDTVIMQFLDPTVLLLNGVLVDLFISENCTQVQVITSKYFIATVLFCKIIDLLYCSICDCLLQSLKNTVIKQSVHDTLDVVGI